MSDPEKSGHTFIDWYLGDALYDFNTPVTAPLTLTARWEEVPSSGGNYYYPTTDTKADDAKGSPKTADPGVALYAAPVAPVSDRPDLHCQKRDKQSQKSAPGRKSLPLEVRGVE